MSRSPLSRICLALASAAGTALLVASTATAQAPKTKPAQATVPKAAGGGLARFLPGKDLIALVEFDGLDAHAAAWKKSSSYKILTQTKLGALLEDFAKRGLTEALANVPPGPKPTPDQILAMGKRLMANGFALSVSGNAADPKTIRPTLVLRGLGTPEGRKVFEPILSLAEQAQPKTETRGAGRSRASGPRAAMDLRVPRGGRKKGT